MILNSEAAARARAGLEMAALLLILIASLVFSLSQGLVDISLGEVWRTIRGRPNSLMRAEIILNIRLPRVLCGALAGGALALCGVVMQAVFRNPLASPYLMGISSGAALGASTYLILWGGASALGLAGWAFGGSLFSSLLVFGAALYSQASIQRMLLAGLAVNVLCTSLYNLIIFISYDAQQLQTMTFWMMGSLGPASWSVFPPLALIVALGLIFFMGQGRQLNLLTLGDEDAYSLGLNPRRRRLVFLLAAAFLTAFCVAHFGAISFVGLIIPHIARFLVGANHRRLTPWASLLGAIFMVWVDWLSRGFSALEIPLGVITGILGAPFFLWLILKPERRPA